MQDPDHTHLIQDNMSKAFLREFERRSRSEAVSDSEVQRIGAKSERRDLLGLIQWDHESDHRNALSIKLS